jgi:hypothetical protein
MKCDHLQNRERKSIRLKGYDYRISGAYFVTLVAGQRELEQNVRATRPTRDEILDSHIRWVNQTEDYRDRSPLREVNRTRRSLVPRGRLGSNAITTNISGMRSTEIRYMPWGTTRYTYGSSPTTFQFTWQRLQVEIVPVY